jgi:TonB family protein
MKTAITASVAIHVLVGAGLLLLPARKPRPPKEPTEIVFYRKPVSDPAPIARPEPPRPRPQPVERKTPASRPPAPERRAAAPQPLPAPVPPAPPPVAIAQAAPAAPPVTRPAPKVQTDVFGREAKPAPAQRSAGTVRQAGFAAFERVAGFAGSPSTLMVSRPRGDVARAAFDAAASPSPAAPRGAAPREVVAVTGFTIESAPAAAEAPSTPTGNVRLAGFGEAAGEAPVQRPRERPATALDVAVEIVSKPSPLYTEQARQQRVEGEVVLEVVFDASGELRVLRVLSGLGFGLDEAAVRAAEKISFKPARRDGRPVDHTATLRVVFRLA